MSSIVDRSFKHETASFSDFIADWLFMIESISDRQRHHQFETVQELRADIPGRTSHFAA
jgi:hypothetical protein